MAQILGFIGALVIFAVLSALASESRSKNFTRGLMKTIDKPLARAVKKMEKLKLSGRWKEMGECIVFPPLVPVLRSKGLDSGNWRNYVEGSRQRLHQILAKILPHNTQTLANIFANCANNQETLSHARVLQRLVEITELYVHFHDLEIAFFDGVPDFTKLWFYSSGMLRRLEKALAKHGKSFEEFKRALHDPTSDIYRYYAKQAVNGMSPADLLAYMALCEGLDDFTACGAAVQRRLKESIDDFVNALAQLGVSVRQPTIQIPAGSPPLLGRKRYLYCGESVCPDNTRCVFSRGSRLPFTRVRVRQPRVMIYREPDIDSPVLIELDDGDEIFIRRTFEKAGTEWAELRCLAGERGYMLRDTACYTTKIRRVTLAQDSADVYENPSAECVRTSCLTLGDSFAILDDDERDGKTWIKIRDVNRVDGFLSERTRVFEEPKA